MVDPGAEAFTLGIASYDLRRNIIRENYFRLTESQTGDVLWKRVGEYLSFEDLPFFERQKRRFIKMDAPSKREYNEAKDEIRIRGGTVSPKWYSRAESFDEIIEELVKEGEISPMRLF
ncbi:MAG: hypothetical protein IH845_03105 [Nanoarchaeota archaeon]|nr:hypothetical protein [Nanoarchaeota archaeon]